MGFIRNAACWLGLVDQGWVRVRGPGVEVVITGEKERVQRLMLVVQEELIQVVREEGGRPRSTLRRSSSTVMPSEFDDRDSPYVLNGRVLRPRPRPASGTRRPSAASTRGTKNGGTLRSLAKPQWPASPVTADSETEQVHFGVLLEITEQ